MTRRSLWYDVPETPVAVEMGPQIRTSQPLRPVAIAPQFSADVVCAIVGGTPFDMARKVPIPGGLDGGGVDIRGRIFFSPFSSGYNLASDADDVFPIGANVTVLTQAFFHPLGGPGTFLSNSSTGTDDVNIFAPYSGDSNAYFRWGGETAGTSSLSVAGLTFKLTDWWAFTAGPRGNEIWQNFKRVGSNGAGTGVSRTGSANALTIGQGFSVYSFSMFVTLRKQMSEGFLSSGNYWQLFEP